MSYLPPVLSAEMIDRVHDLLDGHRIILVSPTVAICASDSGNGYHVEAQAGAVTCNCEARNGWCVHALAAAVLWRESAQRDQADDQLRREVFG